MMRPSFPNASVGNPGDSSSFLNPSPRPSQNQNQLRGVLRPSTQARGRFLLAQKAPSGLPKRAFKPLPQNPPRVPIGHIPYEYPLSSRISRLVPSSFSGTVLRPFTCGEGLGLNLDLGLSHR